MCDIAVPLQAADRYEAAWKLRTNSHAALYNWGVALSDMARVIKSTDKEQAHELLRQSAEKYSMSLQWNPHNPQVSRVPLHQCMTHQMDLPWQRHNSGNQANGVVYCILTPSN